MSKLGAIFSELSIPGDQLKAWYEWCGNQCTHALFGVIVAILYAPHPIIAAAVIGGAKEIADMARFWGMRTAIDSAWDLAFWLFGAWFITAHIEMQYEERNVALILMGFALVCGIIPRIRNKERAA